MRRIRITVSQKLNSNSPATTLPNTLSGDLASNMPQKHQKTFLKLWKYFPSKDPPDFTFFSFEDFYLPTIFFLFLSCPPVCVFLRKPLPALLFTRQRAPRLPTTSMVRHFPASPCSSSPMSGRGPSHLPRVLPAASDEEAPFQCYYYIYKKKKPKVPGSWKGVYTYIFIS